MVNMTNNGFASNISSEEGPTLLSHEILNSFVERSVKTLAYGMVAIFSVIGNSLVLAAFKLNTSGKLRTVNNMFIVSMATADLLLTLGSTPERITRALVSDQWLVDGNVGIFLCKTANYLEKLCMIVSILHLSMVAMDRFLVVLYPRRKIITKKRALRIIIIAWLVSAVYCVPLFYYANLLEKKDQLFCKTRRFFKNWRIWYLVFLSLLLVTLLLVVVLYSSIAIHVYQNKTPGLHRRPTSVRLNNRIIKMVAMILLAFYCCFLPYWIGWVFCSFYRVFCNDTYTFISIFLIYANSAINPIIYSFFNENFQIGFRCIARELCGCKKNLNPLVRETRQNEERTQRRLPNNDGSEKQFVVTQA